MTYPRVDSDAPPLETVPARRRPDSTGLLEMPASLLKDELALLDLPDLDETLFVWDGSKRRENILIFATPTSFVLCSFYLLHPTRLGGPKMSLTRSGIVGPSATVVRSMRCGVEVDGGIQGVVKQDNARPRITKTIKEMKDG